MLKRSFIALSKLQLEYRSFADLPAAPEPLPVPDRAVLLVKGAFEKTEGLLLEQGQTVQTGQKLLPFEGSDGYAISPITGTIADLSPFTGDYGQAYTAVTIDREGDESADNAFTGQIAAPTLEAAREFLEFLPGMPDFSPFTDPDTSIDTLIVSGVDKDLLVTTSQYVVRTRTEQIEKGIHILKEITGVSKVVVALPSDIVQNYGDLGGKAVGIDPVYPAGIPRLIVNQVLGEPLPAGKRFEDAGIAFMSAEAVASIGEAFLTGRIPTLKTLTLIRKDGSKEMLTAPVGTPVGSILKAFDVTVNDMDRIILGGPMTGASIFTETHPIQPDTDAIIIQDLENIPLVSDYPCINCGECVRVCPTQVPVNMLVRFLEAGQYEEAVIQYDLHSCIDCGLCSFVCVAKIPIFQYIRLAKFELDRMQPAEAANE